MKNKRRKKLDVKIEIIDSIHMAVYSEDEEKKSYLYLERYHIARSIAVLWRTWDGCRSGWTEMFTNNELFLACLISKPV